MGRPVRAGKTIEPDSGNRSKGWLAAGQGAGGSHGSQKGLPYDFDDAMGAG